MNIFTYGSLTFPEVMRKVVGRDFKADGAELNGYARFRIKDESYPGLIPFPDISTDGVVYFDVDDATVERLDRFEGDMYERVDVTVLTEDNGWVDAETYVLRPRARKRLSAEPWDEYEFGKHHLAEFMRTYAGFAAAQQSK